MSDERQPPIGDSPPEDAAPTPRHRAPGSPDWQVPSGTRREVTGLVVVALVTFAFALFMALVSVGGILIADELREDGRYADATVATVAEDSRTFGWPVPQTTCTTRVTVKFTDARGLGHRAMVRYPGCDTALAVGDVITVLYPPSSPTSAVRAEDSDRAPTEDAVFTGAFAVFFSVTTVLFVRRAIRSIAVRRARRASGHTGRVPLPPTEA